MKKTYTLLVALFFSGNISAQQGTWLWATEGSAPSSNSGAEGLQTALDQNNNCYLSGFFTDTITAGAYTLITPVWSSFVIKYDTTGKVLWAQQSNSANFDYAQSCGLGGDKWGSTYETGFFYNNVSFGAINLTEPGGSSGAFLTKYSAVGNVLWAKQSLSVSAASSCNPTALAVDRSGNSYLTGGVGDSVSFGPIKFYPPPPLYNGNYFVAKYDSGGNVLWVSGASRSLNIVTSSIAVDEYGNSYVTGIFWDTLVVGPDTLISNTYNDIFIMKYDANGNMVWLRKADILPSAKNILDASFIAVSNDGSLYLTGDINADINFDSVNINSTRPYAFTFFIAKFDANGYAIWGKTSQASAEAFSTGSNIVTDTLGHVYLSVHSMYGYPNVNQYQPDTIIYGSSNLSVFDPGKDGNTIIYELDTAGNVLCSNILGGGGDDQAYLAVNPSNRFVYLGGDMFTSIVMGPDTLPYYNTEAPFMARWQPCNTCNLQISFTPPAILCSGESDTLIATGGTTYYWSPSSGLSATTGSSVIASPTITTTYEATASAGSCVDSAQVIVTVIPSPNKPTFTIHNDTLISSSKYDNQWYRNDTLLTDDTSQQLIISVLGNYRVIVNNEANGCSTSSDSVNITSLTGINQLRVNNDQLSIYPNPASGQFIIQLNSNQNGCTVEIYNVLGEEVYQLAISNSQNGINLSSQAAGIYFVYLRWDEGLEVGKMLITK